MTREEQAKFLEELFETTQSEIKSKLSRVPEHWTGIELRQWFSEIAARTTSTNFRGKRKDEYDNDVIINNL